MPAIEFSRTHSYLPAADGISLPVFLNNGAEKSQVAWARGYRGFPLPV